MRGSRLGGMVRELEVRVGDHRLLEVLVDAGTTAAVGAHQLELDPGAVIFVPLELLFLSTSGWFLRVSMRSSTLRAGRPLPVFERITIGLPVVSMP